MTDPAATRRHSGAPNVSAQGIGADVSLGGRVDAEFGPGPAISPPPSKRAGNPRVLVVPCAYNENPKIGTVLDRLNEVKGVDVLVVDDASTDGTTALIRRRAVATLRHQRRSGAGACVRSAIRYFLAHHHDVLILMAGNDKDRPAEIPRLVDPILRDECDLVQGSRYCPGGQVGNMPLYRQIATRCLHPWLFSWLSGQRMTDTTNGFRAIGRKILEDPRLNLQASWLDGYELEPYLLYKAIQLGYRVAEVPVTKIYPPKALGYTKMRPIIDWWSILRPMLLLGLGLKR